MKFGTKIFAVLCFVFALLTLLPDVSYCAEVIKNFDSIVRIEKDSSLGVTEKITVDVKNIDIKRGIIRHFPVDYKDSDGRALRVGLYVDAALIDGRETNFEVRYEGGFANIIIGDPDVMISPGVHTFTIQYRTTRQIGFFEDHDELYWNVTGNGWSWPIESASCSVSLPQEFANENFNSVEWYVGKFGEKGDARRAKLVGKDRVITTSPLAPQEGITVVYTWKKGLVFPPASAYGNEKAQSVTAVATLLLSLAWLIFCAVRCKSPTDKAVIPLFYPPENSSPALVRYIKKATSDRVSMTSNIVDLAVKGLIKIEEREEEKFFGLSKKNIFTLRKLKDTDGLPRDEEAVMMRLFPSDNEKISVTKDYAEEISSAFMGLRRGIAALTKKLNECPAMPIVTAGLIFAAGTAAALPFIGEDADHIVIAAIAGAVFFVFSVAAFKPKSSRRMDKIKSIVPRIVFGVFMTFIASSLFEGDEGLLLISLPYIWAAAAASCVSSVVAHRSEKGAELDRQVDGLELYITVAEKDRLEMLNAPEETPELYERLLPYAMALGAAKTWGDRFADVLKSAEYNPTWYSGHSPYIFMHGNGLSSFSDAMESRIAETVASISKSEFAPGTFSGAGGGGFSGGGSGW
ncbi:MAG: DUF2207 domain-containing protein [Synergistes sp.]|nr:DUF2207 domain-containing protein [Synergistes sp.]